MSTATARGRSGVQNRPDTANPWNALWAMMVGFFMILLDSTIVAVANPRIMANLGTGYETVIWVTSAYLLAYAVPLLVAGRLGDRYGPTNLYLIGLAIFTAASLWCGLSGTIGMLIAARVVQGIGAGILTPQTLSVITRTFPPERRGMAMSVWGATAGVATLVGPLAGGVLVDTLGWAWIFFVNVPIGVIGLGLAFWLVPVLDTHRHRFDLVGVALSGVAMFLIVFALQEGQSNGWAPWIWAVLVAGIGFMTGFVYWQSIRTDEPLIPLEIFRDRDFSLANLGGVVIALTTTAMILPLMFYAQAVCGLSPTRSALLIAPMPITSGLLAPAVGKITDRSHPRTVIGFGFSAVAIALTWLSIVMTSTTPIWQLVLPFVLLGVGMAFIWSPLAATATRNLAPRLAGASSGVFNAARQVGAVLGSAGMASFMTSRISSTMPPMPDGGSMGPHGGKGAALQLPGFLREPFAAAMSQSMLLPAFIALFGVVAALFMLGFSDSASRGDERAARGTTPDAPTRRVRVRPSAAEGFAGGFDGFRDGFDDDDDYVEYTLRPSSASSPRPSPAAVRPARYPNEGLTEPLTLPTEQLRAASSQPAPAPEAKPIGFVHNGSHVDDEQRFRPVEEFSPRDQHSDSRIDRHDEFFDDIDTYGGGGDRASRPRTVTPPGGQRNGYHLPSQPDPPTERRHRRADPDDPPGLGRHSSPGF